MLSNPLVAESAARLHAGILDYGKCSYKMTLGKGSAVCLHDSHPHYAPVEIKLYHDAKPLAGDLTLVTI